MIATVGLAENESGGEFQHWAAYRRLVRARVLVTFCREHGHPSAFSRCTIVYRACKPAPLFAFRRNSELRKARVIGNKAQLQVPLEVQSGMVGDL